MTDKQKVYYGFVCLEETVEQGVIKVMEELEDFEIVDIDDPRGELPSLKTYLEQSVKEEKLIPEEPLWVVQQENKKLWRKR